MSDSNEVHRKYCRNERGMSPEKNAPKEIRKISTTELTVSVVVSAVIPVRIVPRIPGSSQPDVFPAQYLSPRGENR